MSNSQTAISEQQRKRAAQIWSGLVWTGMEIGVDSLSFWSIQNGKWHCCLAANDMYSISVIFQVIYIYYKVNLKQRGACSRLYLLVLTGSEQTSLGNCGNHMYITSVWPDAPALSSWFCRYPSVSALSQLLIIKHRIQGGSAVISEARLLRLLVKWLYWRARVAVCLSVCERPASKRAPALTCTPPCLCASTPVAPPLVTASMSVIHGMICFRFGHAVLCISSRISLTNQKWKLTLVVTCWSKKTNLNIIR